MITGEEFTPFEDMTIKYKAKSAVKEGESRVKGILDRAAPKDQYLFDSILDAGFVVESNRTAASTFDIVDPLPEDRKI